MKIRILVTGACGFIGSHLVEKLAKNKKYKVTALCFYNSSNSIGNMRHIPKNILNKINIVFGDIRSEDFIQKITKGQDIVFHLAALISIPYSYRSPKSYIDTNLVGTYNIINSCKINKTKKIIVTSTSEVYGTAQYVPIDENHPLVAQSPYSASKIAADQLSISFQKTYNLPIIIARPFNTFGPRQSSRAIIPTLITQMIKNKNRIKVGNISTKRDFTFIDDTVDAFIKLINIKNCYGEIMNISSGYEIKISELIKLISKELKIKKLQVFIDKKRIRPKNSEVYRLLASSKKIKKFTNWKPYFNNKKKFISAINKTSKWLMVKKNLENHNTEIYNL